MRNTWWKSGQWNVLCDVCGFKFKNVDLKKRWDGLMVCEKDYEARHPQESIRPVPDQQKLPWTRPDPGRASSGGDSINTATSAATVVASYPDTPRAAITTTTDIVSPDAPAMQNLTIDEVYGQI